MKRFLLGTIFGIKREAPVQRGAKNRLHVCWASTITGISKAQQAKPGSMCCMQMPCNEGLALSHILSVTFQTISQLLNSTHDLWRELQAGAFSFESPLLFSVQTLASSTIKITCFAWKGQSFTSYTRWKAKPNLTELHTAICARWDQLGNAAADHRDRRHNTVFVQLKNSNAVIYHLWTANSGKGEGLRVHETSRSWTFPAKI